MQALREAYKAVRGYIETLERLVTTPGSKTNEAATLSHLSSKAVHNDPTFLAPEYIDISGYTESTVGLVLFIIFSLATFGVLPLVAKWKPQIWCTLARSSCRAFRDANFVLVTGPNGKSVELPILSISSLDTQSTGRQVKHLRYFEYRKQRYIYKEMFSNFQRQNARLFESFPEIHNMRYGKSTQEADTLMSTNGSNSIDIGYTHIYTLLLDKASHPFYIFQIASVAIWLAESYTSYALLIVALSLASISWEVYTSRTNEHNQRELTRDQSGLYPVLRDGVLHHLESSQLVLGDAIVLSAAKDILEGSILACDMVIIQGECVMDESTLTGETVPVMKLALPYAVTERRTSMPGRGPSHDFRADDMHSNSSKKRHAAILNPDKHRQHTLFAGSQFVEIKPRKNWIPSMNSTLVSEPEMAIAIVMATGFASSKGELFRSILYPNHIEFKFNSDSYKYLVGLSIIACVAFLNRSIHAYRNGSTLQSAILSSLDLITIAVPPALPLILTVGTGLSMERLKKAKIFCTSPNRINYSGRVNVICWDKTGTLTTPNLHFYGVSHVDNQVFSSIQHYSASTEEFGSTFNKHTFRLDDDSSNLAHVETSQVILLQQCMLVCHGLTVNERGGYTGHTIDMEMFRVTNWKLRDEDYLYSLAQTYNIPIAGVVIPRFPLFTHQANSTNAPLSETETLIISDIPQQEPTMYILKRFDFDPHTQRSTVIASLGHSPLLNWCIFTKGSAEAIRHVCDPHTIPHNYFDTCQSFTMRGLYVIACAYRPTTIQEFPQHLTSELLLARRDKVERNMIFLGFLLFENPLKSEAQETITAFKDAKIRNVIITGDNAFTAVHVARELGLCKHTILIDTHESQVRFSEIPEPPDISSAISTFKDLSLQAKPNPTLPSRTATDSFLNTSFVSMDARRHIHIDDLIYQLSQMPAQTEIAITGDALSVLSERPDTEFVDWIVGRTRVFSRIKPDQKSWIVERLIMLGKCVAMCGDGANDCGALKSAHVGLALSNSEASMVAPFTSANENILDMVCLVREGRCALETSFVAFKYMTLYPIIQLMMSATLNQYGSALSNNQFFFDNVFVVTLLAFSMLYTKPFTSLAQDRPTDSLLSPLVLASVLAQVLFSAGFFCINVAMTFSQPWFCSVREATAGLNDAFLPNDDGLTHPVYPCYPIDPDRDVTQGLVTKSFENTSIWLFSHCMFISVSLVFMSTARFRSPPWTNYFFASSISVITCVLVAMLLLLLNSSPIGSLEYSDVVSWLFSIQPGIPISFRFGQLGVLIAYTAIAVLWEVFVVDVHIRRITTQWEMASMFGRDWKRDRAAGVHNMQEDEHKMAIMISGVEEDDQNSDSDAFETRLAWSAQESEQRPILSQS
ncbi:hypothetical protein BDEG_23830 [Batrachochytrium dendrobatidis JEL423]|uniref:Cation-transporting ATPase n=1 Tax=Batrachochytrium dendrobatidis (strain JEL423) TaxID=403673 RepID=A0A177WKZ2_BATDL|nr:hypothetical protein BDEG_23830 [Batrachochytrium dendrobatidis JEL423]